MLFNFFLKLVTTLKKNENAFRSLRVHTNKHNECIFKAKLTYLSIIQNGQGSGIMEVNEVLVCDRMSRVYQNVRPSSVGGNVRPASVSIRHRQHVGLKMQRCIVFPFKQIPRVRMQLMMILLRCRCIQGICEMAVGITLKIKLSLC